AGQDSYLYFGHIFDKCDDDDPSFDPGGGVGQICVQSALWELTMRNPLEGGHTANTDSRANENIDVGFAATNFLGLPPGAYGNGGNTLYRYREGIERFFITDINNPAASSVAQSTVFVYFDIVTVTVAIDRVDYNHVPGGANVLFMDGHVEWLKYNDGGRAPANPNTARGIGASIG
ncbi:MAG: hypothetical protein Q8N51_03135, partial [Gammaproteobacteria bacterium]|nr:hypothetical protein [Gammaproteobacteria bacterium]